MQEEALQRILADRFVLVRKVGEGGMGRVYEALDRDSGERLALKVLPRLSGERLYLFKREFRALDDIKHPNLISLRELHNDGDTWFFTMEFVEGEDFRSYVRPAEQNHRGKSPEPVSTLAALSELHAVPADTVEADASTDVAFDTQKASASGFDLVRLCSALAQLVRALQVLHGTGRIHRDVKPGNVLVTDDERLVLLDFGLVAELESRHFPSITRDERLVGTVAYMSPEQAMSSSEIDEATDWYAVGVMLYEVLTGERPFTGPPVKVLLSKQKETPTPPAELSDGVPEALSRLAMDLLAIDPAERLDGSEILERLGEFAGSGDVDGQTVAPRARMVDETFVGRADELGRLRDAWEDVRDDSTVSIISGEAGVGKSMLVRRFLDGLAEDVDELVVLFGRCYESETVPFKAFDGVIDALSHFLKRLDPLDVALLLPGDMSELVRVFPVLDRVPAVEQLARQTLPERNARDVRLRAFECLRKLLGRIGSRYPLVLYIDDIQWADSDSLVLLNDLIDSESAPRMLLVATRRPADEGVQEPLEKRLRDVDVRVMTLGGLSAEEVNQFVADIDAELELESVDEARSEWLEQAEGHPLLLQELVRHYAETSNDPDSVPSLTDLIWRRIEGLDSETRHLVEVCGLAGIPLPLQTVQFALEMSGDSAHRAAQTAKTLHLVRLAPRDDRTTVEPYHDRIRETTRDNLSDECRLEYTQALVDAMRETGVSEKEPLAFVSMLVDVGADEEAAREAIRAAQRASDALAFESAAQLYKIARRVGSFSGERDRELRLAIAENLSNAGHGAEAPDYWISAIDGAGPEERLQLRQRAAVELISHGDIDRGSGLLREVLSEIGESLPENRLWLFVLILWNRFWLWARGWNWDDREEDEIPDSDKTRARVYRMVALRIGMLDSFRSLYFQTRQLRLSMKYGYKREIAIAMATEGQFTSVTGKRGDLETTEEALAIATDLAQEVNDPRTILMVRLLAAIADYFRARYARSHQALEEYGAELEARPEMEQYMVNAARLFDLYTVKYLGRLREVRRKFDDYERDAMYREDGFMLTGIRWWCSFAFLAIDRVDKARRLLEDTHWRASGGQMQVFEAHRAFSRAEVAFYDGTVGEERAELELEIEAATTGHIGKLAVELRGMAHWIRARLALAEADTLSARDERRVERSIKALDEEYLRPYVMYARLLEAGLARRRGESSAARSALRRAIRIGEENDLEMFVACAKIQLSRLMDGESAEEARTEALEWMTTEGVAEPESFARIFVPGFD